MQQLKVNRIPLQHLLCCKKNNAKFFCCSEQCKNNAFVCRKQDCTCLPQMHKQCEFLYAQSLIDHIQQKKVVLTPQIQAATRVIQTVYQQAIDKLSQDRQALLKWKQSYGLTFQEIQFLQLINSNKQAELTGAYIHSVKKSSKKKQDLSWLSQTWINDFWKKGRRDFHKLFNELNKLIPYKKEEFVSSSNYIDSKIVDDSCKLKQFFGQNKQIQEFRLLYRATQNQFSTDRFHQICDSVKNTLTIARTQHNKVLGGYTPIAWQKNANGVTVQDSSGQSFMYSLSLGQKYPLTNKKQAIVHQDKYGPTFGSISRRGLFSGSNYLDGDFRIFTKYGSFNFPVNYGFNNQRDRIQSGQVLISQVIGGTSISTGLKQWQVFQVIFC